MCCYKKEGSELLLEEKGELSGIYFKILQKYLY